VVFYHLYASALAARIATLGQRVRRVHMVAGPLYLESRLIRFVERVLCRLDTMLIAGSEYTAAMYRAIGMPAARVTTIPYGVDLERFDRGTDDRGARLSVTPGTFVAIMVAYVYAPKSAVFPGVGIKGHDTLLTSWSAFTQDRPDSLLVLVGSGFDDHGQSHRQRLIAEHSVETDPRVVWFDSVEDVRPLYSSADVSISPSLSENHGAALEASAMGLASIVSDAGALPETVRPDTGWVVPRGDPAALHHALLDAHHEFTSGRLASRGRAARALAARHFSQQDSTRRVADVVAPVRPPLVLAFSEQRVWRSGTEVRGLKPLAIVDSLARVTPVRLAARVTEDGGSGPAVAPHATYVPVTWPRPGRVVRDGLSMVRHVLREVRASTVVHADQPGVVGALGLVLGKLLGKQLSVNVVGDARESVHPSVVGGPRGRVGHLLLPRIQRWACSAADCTNYVTSTVLQRRYPPRSGAPSYSLSTFSPLGDFRPRPFPHGSVSVITVGSLEQPYKGVADLIDATALAVASGMDISLTVVGSGRTRPSLQEHAARVAPGRVNFTGHLDPAGLYQEMGRHDVFALASWTEGLPRALVEAMADGIPAVATAVGGTPELLEPHRLVPARDAAALASGLRALLSDESAWVTSIHHNKCVSDEVAARKGAALPALVSTIHALAEAR